MQITFLPESLWLNACSGRFFLLGHAMIQLANVKHNFAQEFMQQGQNNVVKEDYKWKLS